MSVMSNTVKTKFAGLLRKLLKHVEDNEAEALPEARKFTPASPAPVPRQQPAETAAGSAAAAPALAAAPQQRATGNEVELPLLPVLEKLSPELRLTLVVHPADLEQASIYIPIDQIVPQLALGSVRITFGQLRAAAPGMFHIGDKYDSLPVVLPLHVILQKLNPSLLSRLPGQKAVNLPTEITGPFGSQTNRPVIAASPARTPASAAPLPVAAPVAQRASAIPTAPRTAAPAIKPIPMPIAPPAAPAVQRAAPIPFSPRTEAPASKPIPMPTAKPPAPATLAPTGPRPTSVLLTPRRETPANPVTPAPIPFAHATPPVPLATAKPEQKTISAPLLPLTEKWPEALRREIVWANLTKAQVALPYEEVESAIKRGRVVFTWRNMRSWIQPTPIQDPSANDNVELELPLKVLAPLFLNQRSQSDKSHTKVAIDTTIPNLFFGFPTAQSEAPESVAGPVTAPVAAQVAAQPVSGPVPEPVRPALKPVDKKLAETNYYVWGDGGEVPKVDQYDYKRTQNPGTDFSSRYITPKDAVARAMALAGVVGAMVALPDGLMVACQLPPDLNADTVAAFLPQIFDRVAQCTRELRMGSLDNLKFTVGMVPWHIFRVNAVYFAAFGRPGESLPAAELASLAGQLDRKR